MKKVLYLLLLSISFTTGIFAQTDSSFYYLNKSSLTNNVLCAFTDSVYWGMFDGVKNKTLKNKYALNILSDLN
jgi:hypothetical protein